MKKISIELTAQELETNLNLLATHPWNQVNALIQTMSAQATQQATQPAPAPIAPAPGPADGAGFVQTD